MKWCDRVPAPNCAFNVVFRRTMLSKKKYRASMAIRNGGYIHAQEDTYIRRELEQCIMTEYAEMRIKAHVPLCDMISFLEQNHGMLIDRAVLRLKPRWEQRKVLPMEGDSIRLIQARKDMEAKKPSVSFCFVVFEDQRLQNLW